MSDKVSRRFSPYMSPDSLRAKLQLSKALYDSHTKKNYGYEDINGSQYSGIIENFGSELLLETRKILMNKPSLKNLFIENTMEYYFDIQYSEYINTYNQQNMLCAVLKKDVFSSDKTYKLKFVDCSEAYILRAESSSDPNVKKEKYYKTTTPPILLIDDTEYVLKLSDDSEIDTVYYFAINELTEEIIDTYDDGIMTTKEITNEMFDLPFIWMCVDIFRLLPDIGFGNNVFNDKEFLVIGTDGHDVSKAYPLENHISTDVPGFIGNWLVKILPMESGSFVDNENYEGNYTAEIQEIQLLYYATSDWDEVDPGIEPSRKIVITYDHTYTKMTLSKFTCGNVVYREDGVTPVPYEGKWYYRTPKEGDYDYDGRTYQNRCYAYTNLGSFAENQINYSKLLNQVPMLTVIFDDRYLHAYEGICENAVTGVHIDDSSDYSDNSVSKKNGVIHDLGDFDGLPSYFSYFVDNTTHRAHVELYTIRDDLNNRNQHITDKQLSAIIVDSAIPAKENEYDNDLDTVIKYDTTDTTGYFYISDEDMIVDLNNMPSEIVYIDEENFGNSTVPKYMNLPKFIYHGNRTFSLGMAGLDPEKEIARVYYLSNDPVSYENNARTKNKKPDRTLARICDIPTDFTQLEKIENLAPTFVFDPLYVRQGAPYTYSNMTELVNNRPSQTLVTSFDTSESIIKKIVVFDNDTDLNEVLTPDILINGYNLDNVGYDEYVTYTGMNDSTQSIDVITSQFAEWTIYNSGSGYEVDDEFCVIIGGLYISGIVTAVTDGMVDSFDFQTTSAFINIGNLLPSEGIIVYDTNTTSGNGYGMQLKLSIDDNKWELMHRSKSDIKNGLYAFKLDEIGYIWIWKYDFDTNTWSEDIQITGQYIRENLYDEMDPYPQIYRDLLNIFMYNTINSTIYLSSSSGKIWYASKYMRRENVYIPFKSEMEPIYHESFIPVIGNKITDNLEDFFKKAIIKNSDGSASLPNRQNIMYTIIPDPNDGDTYDLIHFVNRGNYFRNSGKVYLPKYHSMNLTNYHGYFNTMNNILRIVGRYKDSNVINHWAQWGAAVYDPMQEYSYTYTDDDIKDIKIIDECHKITFDDYFANMDTVLADHNPPEMVNKSGVLMYNMYCYDETKRSDEYDEFVKSINKMTRSQLISYIKNNINPSSEVLRFEETDYAYSSEMLQRYIINSYTDDPVYLKQDITLFRHAGDNVYDPKTKEPIGDQPLGDFVPLTTEIFHPTGYTDKGKSITFMPEFIFRIDDEIEDMTNIKVYDEDGNDVSKFSVLIVNKEIYVYIDDSWVIVDDR